MLDPYLIKKEFPIFKKTIHGKPLVFLDNAASTQKPQCVIDAIVQFYSETYANIHRGIYKLSEESSALYEHARQTLQKLINAAYSHEIIFVKGTTEAINLVAESYGRSHLKPGDHIIITEMEHHANLIPWQYICQQMGAELKVIPVNDQGELDLDVYEQLLSSRTRLVALSHLSNLLGTVNPVHTITEMAHRYGAHVLVDGAQTVAHFPVDVQHLNCDFYVFSGHKMYGPTGIGVLYGKSELLASMPPYQKGGGMIERVTLDKTSYAPLPAKFEAGTPHIAGAAGLEAAALYLEKLGLNNIDLLEQTLLAKATNLLTQIPELRIIGQAAEKSSVISFTLEGVHPHDAATILDQDGIAVRAGHHCAMPLIERFNIPATLRVSFGVYNTPEDIDLLIQSLEKARGILTP